MQLPPQDAQQFSELMSALQHFANQRLGVLPDFQEVEQYWKLPAKQKLELRDALYDHSELIDDFVRENPFGFSADELEIVRRWKHFRRGEFFIERLLKRYAVFIQGDQVYAVLTAGRPLDEVLPFVPAYVNAVLLPFKGKIVYDGLLRIYQVHFGRGIRERLKETYLKAKRWGHIITSLEEQEQEKTPRRAGEKGKARDWGPLLEALAQEAKALRAGRNDPALCGPAFGVVRASIEFARLAATSPQDLDQLWKAFKRLERAMKKAYAFLYDLEEMQREV